MCSYGQLLEVQMVYDLIIIMNSMLQANGVTQFSQGTEPSHKGQAAAWSAYSWILACCSSSSSGQAIHAEGRGHNITRRVRLAPVHGMCGLCASKPKTLSGRREGERVSTIPCSSRSSFINSKEHTSKSVSWRVSHTLSSPTCLHLSSVQPFCFDTFFTFRLTFTAKQRDLCQYFMQTIRL